MNPIARGVTLTCVAALVVTVYIVVPFVAGLHLVGSAVPTAVLLAAFLLAVGAGALARILLATARPAPGIEGLRSTGAEVPSGAPPASDVIVLATWAPVAGRVPAQVTAPSLEARSA